MSRHFVEETQRFHLWQFHRTNRRYLCPSLVLGTCMEIDERRCPGLDSGIFDEWEDIERLWSTRTVPADVAAYLENFLHDSRAWFRASLTTWKSGDVEAGSKQWVRRYEADKTAPEMAMRSPWPMLPPLSPFTDEEASWIVQYRDTGKVPPLKTSGMSPPTPSLGWQVATDCGAGGGS